MRETKSPFKDACKSAREEYFSRNGPLISSGPCGSPALGTRIGVALEDSTLDFSLRKLD
jgi:hypothetical protein